MIKLYRPSNGTEGEIFMAQWCARCERDRAHREGGDPVDACSIATWTMAVSINDPAYPQEWREDGPQGPRCTAFQLGGDCALSPEDELNQLSLFRANGGDKAEMRAEG